MSAHPTQFRRGLLDVVQSVQTWRIWVFLAWEDIAKQYRRTFLGPVWLTVTTATLILAFGLIWSQVFGHSIDSYLPYVTVGHVTFLFASSCITEGTHTFSSSEAYIKQLQLPRFGFAARVVIRNLLILLHNLPIVIVTLLWFDAGSLSGIPTALLSLLLLCIALTFVAVILGSLGARFRDIPLMVSNVMQIAFFATPVLWRYEQLPQNFRAWLDWNPFVPFLRGIRDPLLGLPPSDDVWTMMVAWVVFLAVVGTVTFTISRRRIPYWL